VRARRLVISGRVQGVNFRAFVAECARARGVAGFAENLDDGSVEVWLEGPDEAVASVEDAARRGPSHAEVRAVDASDEAPQGLSSFTRV
jgi:acylphosphatase